MQGLIQRVAHANVAIEKQIVGEIKQGIVLLLGVEKEDDERVADKLLHKVSNPITMLIIYLVKSRLIKRL